MGITFEPFSQNAFEEYHLSPAKHGGIDVYFDRTCWPGSRLPQSFGSYNMLLKGLHQIWTPSHLGHPNLNQIGFINSIEPDA